MAEEFKRAGLRLNLFQNEEFDFQVVRSLGASCRGGATLGECLATAGRIEDGDVRGWAREWAATAGMAEERAEEFAAAGARSAARDAYLRASMYWRAAEYYGFFSEPERCAHWESSVRCFRAAAGLSGYSWEVLEIPFGDLSLPGYFFSPGGGGGRLPTLMVLSGFDGTMEESYFGVAAYALEDGYNVMMFEGPGQAAMSHLHPDRPFMPDFEKPVGAAVDLALSRPDVDPDRLALMGISLGGYFAARAAVHDRRIKACILNSPIIDMHAYFAGSALKNLVELPEEDYEAAMQAVPVIRWVIETFGRRFGARTVPAMLERMKEFNILGREGEIACATLSLVGEGEGEEARRQAELFHARVSGPKAMHVFKAAEGADAHCQVGNLPLASGVILAWLKEVDWGSRT